MIIQKNFKTLIYNYINKINHQIFQKMKTETIFLRIDARKVIVYHKQIKDSEFKID